MVENCTSILQRDRLPSCVDPEWCRTTENRSFDEIMASEWEELVITFDKHKNDYVFKTACCPGAPAC